MRDLLRRLNALPIFDPCRWPAREFLARLCGCVAVTAFLARRLLLLPAFPGIIGGAAWIEKWMTKLTFVPQSLIARPFHLEGVYAAYGYSAADIKVIWTTRLMVWILESGILIGYVLAFLTRERARSVAKGFMEVVFPLLLGGMPFLIVMTEYTFARWMPPSSRAHYGVLCGIFGLVIAGAALNLVGLFTLRKAFTIMTEARVLVRSGVYRFIRHPLYAGHFVLYFGYTLLHLQPLTVALYAAFVAGQVLRARIEEGKLAAAFPEYGEYRRTTGMFFPRLARKT